MENKQISNAVEGKARGRKQMASFKTTEPGIETERAMRKLIEWYRDDQETLPIVNSAIFCHDFLPEYSSISRRAMADWRQIVEAPSCC